MLEKVIGLIDKYGRDTTISTISSRESEYNPLTDTLTQSISQNITVKAFWGKYMDDKSELIKAGMDKVLFKGDIAINKGDLINGYPIIAITSYGYLDKTAYIEVAVNG